MPWEFRSLRADEQAELTGLYIIEREIESYESSEHARLNDM